MKHQTLLHNQADLKQWLEKNLVPITAGDGVTTYISIPTTIRNASQLEHWLKYDLLLTEEEYDFGGI